MNTLVFLRRPDVPGFWPSIGEVATVLISMPDLPRRKLPMKATGSAGRALSAAATADAHFSSTPCFFR